MESSTDEHFYNMNLVNLEDFDTLGPEIENILKQGQQYHFIAITTQQ